MEKTCRLSRSLVEDFHEIFNTISAA